MTNDTYILTHCLGIHCETFGNLLINFNAMDVSITQIW